MSQARNIAMTAVIVVLWVIAIATVLFLLFGCEGMMRDDRNEGSMRFEADFEADTVVFELDLDHGLEDKKIQVKGAP